MNGIELPIGAHIVHGKNKYTVVQVLGSGGFGITYKVKSTIMVGNVPVQTFFAVKELFVKGCFRKDDGCTVDCAPNMLQELKDCRSDFLTEAKRLNELSGKSKNIVRVNEVFEYNNTVYYVMQYLDGGEMSKHIEREGALSEARALSLIRPVAEAVELIHKDHLLHLDIKPENIVLMTSDTDATQYPVLIDFGLAKHFSSSGKPTSAHFVKGASDGYAPMEQYSEIETFSPEMDVYALGATLLYFLTGTNPKNAFKIRRNDIEEALPSEVSGRTRDAIINAMAPLAENRTHDVRTFLQGLEEQYTLPVGHLVESKRMRYRITGILDERPTCIIYNAIAVKDDGSSTGDSHMTGRLSDRSNKTQRLRREDAVKSNGQYQYRLYELYDRSRSARSSSFVVSGIPTDSKRLFEQMIASQNIGKGEVDEYEGQIPSGEVFEANGTRYFSVLQTKKASSLSGMVPKLRSAVRPVAITLAGAALVAGIFFAVKGMTGQSSQIEDVPIEKSEEQAVTENTPDEAQANTDAAPAVKETETEPKTASSAQGSRQAQNETKTTSESRSSKREEARTERKTKEKTERAENNTTDTRGTERTKKKDNKTKTDNNVTPSKPVTTRTKPEATTSATQASGTHDNSKRLQFERETSWEEMLE